MKEEMSKEEKIELLKKWVEIAFFDQLYSNGCREKIESIKLTDFKHEETKHDS